MLAALLHNETYNTIAMYHLAMLRAVNIDLAQQNSDGNDQ